MKVNQWAAVRVSCCQEHAGYARLAVVVKLITAAQTLFLPPTLHFYLCLHMFKINPAPIFIFIVNKKQQAAQNSCRVEYIYCHINNLVPKINTALWSCIFKCKVNAQAEVLLSHIVRRPRTLRHDRSIRLLSHKLSLLLEI